MTIDGLVLVFLVVLVGTRALLLLLVRILEPDDVARAARARELAARSPTPTLPAARVVARPRRSP